MMCQSQEIAARIYPEGFQLFRTEEKIELKNGGQGALRSDEFLTFCVSGPRGIDRMPCPSSVRSERASPAAKKFALLRNRSCNRWRWLARGVGSSESRFRIQPVQIWRGENTA
jgi:hypothetical protein